MTFTLAQAIHGPTILAEHPVLGCKIYPRGIISEYSGPPGSGKSQWAQTIVGVAANNNLKGLWINCKGRQPRLIGPVGEPVANTRTGQQQLSARRDDICRTKISENWLTACIPSQNWSLLIRTITALANYVDIILLEDVDSTLPEPVAQFLQAESAAKQSVVIMLSPTLTFSACPWPF